MRVVIQRVSHADVEIEGQNVARIARGFLVLLGIEYEDTNEDIDWLTAKIQKMRVFADRDGAMNLSLEEVAGEILVVSQFTLHASTKKGNRPGFTRAARPEVAIPLYEEFLSRFPNVKHGKFGADMQVTLCNDGPVTIIIDSKNRE